MRPSFVLSSITSRHWQQCCNEACVSHGFDLDQDSFGARNRVLPTGGNHQITALITGSV